MNSRLLLPVIFSKRVRVEDWRSAFGMDGSNGVEGASCGFSRGRRREVRAETWLGSSRSSGDMVFGSGVVERGESARGSDAGGRRRVSQVCRSFWSLGTGLCKYASLAKLKMRV